MSLENGEKTQDYIVKKALYFYISFGKEDISEIYALKCHVRYIGQRDVQMYAGI